METIVKSLIILTFITQFNFHSLCETLEINPYRPTYGGALYGYETTLQQQVEYLSKKLQLILSGRKYQLVNNSITIDSSKDLDGLFFKRFYYDHSLSPTYYDFIPRSVYFKAINLNHQIFWGSIYLIERQFNKSQLFNSTQETIQEIRKGNLFSLSLSDSIDPKQFSLEVSWESLNLSPRPSHLQALVSSSKKIEFSKKNIQLLFQKSKYTLVANSINIDYFSDYGRSFLFRDRYAQLLSFIVKNNESNYFNGTLLIWENTRLHKEKIFCQPCNSTYELIATEFDPNLYNQLIITKKINDIDLSLELNTLEFILSPVQIHQAQ